MNYVRHLNGFFERLASDSRMSSYHISLYLSLFRVWNQNRFRNPFPISREEMMGLSRIGSVNTYARCIKQLDSWGYIRYSPAANWHRGSQVSCIRFDISEDTAGDTAMSTGNDTGSDTLNSKQLKQEEKQVITPQTGNRRNGKEYRKKNPLNASTGKDYSEPL